MGNTHQLRLPLVGSARQRAAFGILERSRALPTLHKRSAYFWTPPNSGCARLQQNLCVHRSFSRRIEGDPECFATCLRTFQTSSYGQHRFSIDPRATLAVVANWQRSALHRRAYLL